MIIIVDDRASVGEAFRSCFGREGVSAAAFSSGDFETWLDCARSSDFTAVDAVLLGDGQSVCGLAGAIRRRSDAAVIALKEQRSLSSTLALFSAGVDDVVGKPCHVRELLARIDAIARRRRAASDDDRPQAGTADIAVFTDGRDALVAGRPLAMSRRELRLLEFLSRNRGRRVTRRQIFDSVYGVCEQEISESAVETHISRLRRRLHAVLGYDAIDCRRHLGYRLVSRPAEAGVPA